MRRRPATVLVVLAAATIILAGCSAPTNPEVSPTEIPTTTPGTLSTETGNKTVVDGETIAQFLKYGDPIRDADVMRFGDAGTNVMVVPSNGTSEGIGRAIGFTGVVVTTLDNQTDLGLVNVDVSDGNSRVLSVRINETTRDRYHSGEYNATEYTAAIFSTLQFYGQNGTVEVTPDG